MSTLQNGGGVKGWMNAFSPIEWAEMKQKSYIRTQSLI